MLTFITPIGNGHEELFQRAKASIEAQTVEVTHLFKRDTQGRGPGYIRNKLLEKVQTRYVAFLDADDWLVPEFAEKTLAAIKRGRYVYTGWYQREEAIEPPEKAWCNGTWHGITSVVSTSAARQVGGFDVYLSGMEDTDFYLKLILRGMCGIRLNEPLYHYHPHGGRADKIHASGEVVELRKSINQRYGGRIMGCCGGDAMGNTAPVGEKQSGDILAMAIWKGNRKEYGRATGRRYRRMSYPKTAWIDPRDADVSPHLWQVIINDPDDEIEDDDDVNELFGVDAFSAEMMERGIWREKPPENKATPNFAKLKRLAKGTGQTKEPEFYFPPEYPSYNVFRRLIDLSGYQYTTAMISSDPDATFIFTGPEDAPDVSNYKARTIFWQLEYTGDYTQQANIDTFDEIWSSDPAHAARTGAKYVMMGSHAGLRSGGEGSDLYDLAMLAYMIPRRQTIKASLPDLRWPPEHPGHSPEDVHSVLGNTGLMLHAHQQDIPAMTPLRYALAAAYSLPLLSEHVSDPGPFKDWILWAEYESLAERVRLILSGKMDVSVYGYALHSALCVQNTFRKTVEAALR